MQARLSNRHRDTVARIFSQPASGNIEWREVVSLLEAVGTVTHERNGKLNVALGPETVVLPNPHGKDVDLQTVVDLWQLLTQAGVAPDRAPAITDERVRDHGDGRWSEPTWDPGELRVRSSRTRPAHRANVELVRPSPGAARRPFPS